MSEETPPEKKPESPSEQSDQPTEQLNNFNQLTKALESFAEQLAKLIVTKNWLSLLVLVDTGLFLFFSPGGVVSKFIKTTFGITLPEQYSIFFWVTVGGIFLAALVIAIKTIAQKSPPLSDFTERKAIKGLRAFSKEDAEIFQQLQRGKDLRECIDCITDDTFRIGVLTGESGVGKISFLQAGIIPNLPKSAIPHQGVYIRFSNQEPIKTIYEALEKEFKLSETQETPIDNRDLLSILSSATKTVDKPLILIFDQFEQFYINHKRESDKKPFINELKNWHKNYNYLVKVLMSVRGDLMTDFFELQNELNWSLSPYKNYFKLKKFSQKEAAKILQVIAKAEKIKFKKKDIDVIAQKLASENDCISPVDLQIFAWTIQGQNEELRAFDRTTINKIGGIEELMTQFLNKTLEPMKKSKRQAAIKVLLAMTNLERNVRAGVLNLDDLILKLKGTLQPSETSEATKWLAHGNVRLITPVKKDGKVGYELAHEKLIPALRKISGEELTRASKANDLLNQRVNEWLGNQKSSRYLFNWQELRLLKQQKPYLVWGTNQTHKEDLLKLSWRKLTRQLMAIAMVLVFSLVGTVWWHTPWGQIQQVGWELARLTGRVNDKYESKAALAFAKDGRFKQAEVITTSIENSSDKAMVLSEIAQTYETIGNSSQAEELLEKALAAAEQIDDSYSEARVLSEIAQTYGTIENSTQAEELLEKALAAVGQIDNSPAEQIDYSNDKVRVLSAIAQAIRIIENSTQAEELLEKALAAVGQIDNSPAEQIDYSNDKAMVLRAIVQTYETIGNSTQAEKLLKQSLAAAEQIDYSSDKALILSEIAQAIGTIDNSPQAEKLLKQSLAAAEQIDYSSDRAWVLSEIAQTYGTIGNSTQAEKLLKQSLAAAEQIDDSYSEAWVLSEIAQTYGTIGNSTQAEKLLKQAIAAAEQIDDSYSEPRVLSAIDYSSDRVNVLSAIAQEIGTIKNFPQAEKLLKQVLAAAEQIDDSFNKAWVLSEIAQTYGIIGNSTQAEEFLEQVLAAAEQIDDSFNKAWVVSAIAQTQAKFAYWRQAHHTVSICPGDDCKVESLAHILTAWAEKRNPALVDLVDKEEDLFFHF